MASYFTKILVLFLIQYHVTVTTSSGANETFKLAIQSAMAKQCQAWYNGGSSKALVPFQFPKGKSLALLHLSIVTPENVGNYYILQKLYSTRSRFGIFNIDIDRDKIHFREGWTNLLIECRAVYAVFLIIKLPKRFEPTINQEQYRWNETVENARGFVFVVSTVVQIKSDQTTIPVNVTCLKVSVDIYSSKYESKFEFSFYRNKTGQHFLAHSNTETDTKIWVDLGSDWGTKRVCLPMTPAGEIGNWSYDMLDEPVMDDDERGFQGKIMHVGNLLVILAIIIMLLSSLAWTTTPILREPINSTTTPTTGQFLGVDVIEPDMQSTRF